MAAGGGGRPKTGSGERPYSVSKDEAYARMLQEEEYSARAEEDAQLARRMQQDMMLGIDNSTDSDDNQHTASSGESAAERRRKRREERRDQPMHRMMTPITELFTTLVMGSMRQRHPYFYSGGEPGTGQEDSDEDVNPNGTTGFLPLHPSASEPSLTPRGALIGGRPPRPQVNQRTRRVSRHHGMRPLETGVQTVETPRPIIRGTITRGTTTGTQPRGTAGRGMVIRGNRNQRSRATSVRGGITRRNSSSSQTSDVEGGEDNTQAPNTMEPSVPPLSLAIQQPELPDGEVEPEIVLLDGGGSDSRFVHIMRDPILLLLFLMGRAPGIMVPDDIDPNDYESLWELAERLGEVKNKGMTDDEMKTLPKKSYSSHVKHKKGEEPACRVCLHDFKRGESVCTLPCKHEYHHNCITEWLKRNASCPICRYELKSC